MRPPLRRRRTPEVDLGRPPLLVAPRLGMKGIFRLTIFKDVAIASGSGVGGGSLGYANTLYRAPVHFYEDAQWSDLNDWQTALAPHYETAEQMLGVATYDEDDPPTTSCASTRRRSASPAPTRRPAWACSSASPGVTVQDPFFGGDGPDRTGCLRCGRCMVGCPLGAKNTLVKNYLWFAEKAGAKVMPERTVTDILPLGPPTAPTARRHHRALRRGVRRERTPTRRQGVIVAAGALGTNRLLQACRLNGSLPKLSPRLGELVRTNSEAILAVTLPPGAPDVTRRVAITGSIYPDPQTHIETVVYGDAGDGMSGLFTLLTGAGTPITRPLKLAGAAVRHPVHLARTLNPRGWSKRTIIVLVMQSLDNAIPCARGAGGTVGAAAAPSRTRAPNPRSSPPPTRSRSGSPSAPGARPELDHGGGREHPVDRAHPRRRGDRRRPVQGRRRRPQPRLQLREPADLPTAPRSRPTWASIRASRSPRWPSTR